MADIPRNLVDALGDRYAIEREIGVGGMATVYLAEDLKHRRKVAVKVLRPELAASLGADRFLREIEIAAGLTHPHVLPLHDSGGQGGVLYYVMPYIEGESLRGRLSAEGALPPNEAARIFRGIVDALGAAHERGVVHRDVKPANVLLSGGHALVADFGVAKAVSDAADRKDLTTMGVALGTPEYMAPEQATADPNTDHRADLFAAGVIAYEMLTGTSPFEAENTRAVFAALMSREPAPPSELRPEAPSALSDLVMRCLDKDPDGRPQSASELLAQLDAFSTPSMGVAPATGSYKRRSWSATPLALGAVVVVAAAVAGWRWNQQRSAIAYARQNAVPEVIRLVGENQLLEAATLALTTEEVLGADPVLEPLWPRMSSPFRVTSDPPDALISYRPYESDDSAWAPLGRTPYETERLPVGAYRFRIEKDGFEPVDEVRSLIPANLLAEHQHAGFDYLEDPSYTIDVDLSPVGSLPEGMVAVAGGPYGTIPVLGFGPVQPRVIPEYLIDRTEVTNAAYREFVAAGAYLDSSLWEEPFTREGTRLSFETAMAQFLDSTGRPGPASWILGEPPEGQETYPVAGLSWFEASAYCRWRGKSLPTLYHWARAALPSSDPWIPFNPLLARASNFDEALVPVGSLGALGVAGAEDLAGNVREWASTVSGDGRYLLGGAWSDPIYFLHDAYAAPPWQREVEDGVRCAEYTEGVPPEHLRTARALPPQDFSRGATMSDELFASQNSFMSYDNEQPLGVVVDSVVEHDWGATEQWVSVDGAYGQRLPIRLHFPTELPPPYEPIIFFGGGNVIRSGEMEDPQPPLDYLIRSGRVLVEPAYDGTFMRNDGRTIQRMGGPGSTELFAHWVQDLGRTIDFLEEHADFDHTEVVYLGLSLGASMVPTLIPFEPRFKAVILFSGGYGRRETQPSLDHRMSLAGRMQIPILMMGGENDFHLPPAWQQAMFDSFGTPPEDKRIRIFESGHWPLPMNEVIRETVDFLERHVGPGGG
ncbi:MAG: protein kinase domain-containing protein [Longimicrobiales bacterium]